MPDVPPSYATATSRAWIIPVAPYLFSADLSAASRVSQQWHRTVGPLLWADPLRMCTIHPSDHTDWFLRLAEALLSASETCREWVRVIDFGRLVLEVESFDFTGSVGTHQRLADAVARLPRLLPNVRAVYTGACAHFDTSKVIADFVARCPVQVVSLAGYQGVALRPHTLPPHRYAVVDLSNIPDKNLSGALARGGPSVWQGRDFGILRVRNSGINASDLAKLVGGGCQGLVCLDVRDNGLADDALAVLLRCFGGRVESNTDVSGRYIPSGPEIHLQNSGGLSYSKFIQESELSALFQHPDRFMVPPPRYGGSYSSRICEAGVISTHILHDTLHNLPSTSPMPSISLNSVFGPSHLHLSGNGFSPRGICALLAHSSGTLEVLDADASPDPTDPLDRWDPYVLRAAILPRLVRAVVHHSVVTGVVGGCFSGQAATTIGQSSKTNTQTVGKQEPSVKGEQRMENTLFVPDMNPNIRELTLTDIPALAAPILAQQLVHFLNLLAAQEEAIRSTKTPHAGGLVTGLRKLILVVIRPKPVQRIQGEYGWVHDVDMPDLSAPESWASELNQTFEGASGVHTNNVDVTWLWYSTDPSETPTLQTCRASERADVVGAVKAWRKNGAWSGEVSVQWM